MPEEICHSTRFRRAFSSMLWSCLNGVMSAVPQPWSLMVNSRITKTAQYQCLGGSVFAPSLVVFIKELAQIRAVFARWIQINQSYPGPVGTENVRISYAINVGQECVDR